MSSLLRVKGVSKSFGGTPALKDISFEAGPGEILGLIGENGAGKSTLIKILSGVYQPDHGSIEWKDQPFNARDPHAALLHGIATIHQELASFEKLTVAENLMLGERWPRFVWGGTNRRALNAEARRRLEACKLTVDPSVLFHTLSPAQRQEVAIARSLAQNAQLLILDEPTAALSEPEVVRLIDHLKMLQAEGVTILYVSHRLDEILKLTSRVLVLRDGSLVASHLTSRTSISALVRDMVGRELNALFERKSHTPGEIIFAAQNLSRAGLFHGITFTIRAGEVLGLSGLVGAGRSELARAIYGLYPPESGTMMLNGHPHAPPNPAAARASKLTYLPEERKRQGFVLDHSLKSAISIGFLKAISRLGVLNGRWESKRVSEAITRFHIKARTPDQPLGTLSGGNQQKAPLARCLESDPILIILDEPTRGVDVGAKAEIHKLINELAQSGKAVLLISSDLPEILSLSDRILVLYCQRITAEFDAKEATQEAILLAASGLGALH
jgi:ABC-type sugar transport system ATPase subunit